MRGYCIGSLVAFDKHWNFALIDVDEVYKRKRLRKAAPLVCEDKLNKQLKKLKCHDQDLARTEKSSETHNEYNDDGKKEAIYRKETIGASIMRIQEIKRKSETCHRHVPQLLVRGEHVASVALM